MSESPQKIEYIDRAIELLGRIGDTQKGRILEAAAKMAGSIVAGGLVHVFGSGHSVIPVLDVFPRYGGFVGFHPIMDPRLMWFNVVGPGGAPELLWIERAEGYIANFLKNFELDERDTMLIYSHGGLNAAPVEAALYAKKHGLQVVAVTSGDNYRQAKPTHSSGESLGSLADVLIDNCVPLEDAMIHIDGLVEPVSAGSTLSIVAITMSLVSETARELVRRGCKLSVFVSPNVTAVPRDHNERVFKDYAKSLKR